MNKEELISYIEDNIPSCDRAEQSLIFKLCMDKILSFSHVMAMVEQAKDRESEQNRCKFIEASTVLHMMLTGNWKGDNLAELKKRANFIANKNDTIVTHLNDKAVGYTDDDEKRFDDQFEMLYGFKL